MGICSRMTKLKHCPALMVYLKQVVCGKVPCHSGAQMVAASELHTATLLSMMISTVTTHRAECSIDDTEHSQAT